MLKKKLDLELYCPFSNAIVVENQSLKSWQQVKSFPSSSFVIK
jgi:hypothetical protein